MAAKVGELLNHEPTKLRLTIAYTTNGKAESVIKCGLNQTIAEITSPSSVAPSVPIILYEKLDANVIEPNTKRNLKVIWTGIHDQERSIRRLSLSKSSTVHDLIGELSKQVQLTPTGTGKIRVFMAEKDGKTWSEFTGSEAIGDIPDPVELFAEEILPEESVQWKGGTSC